MKISTILPFALVLIAAACTKRTDCPSYPSARLVWIPYAEGEQRTFECGNATQTFVFNDVYSTSHYTINTNESTLCECKAYSNSDIDSVNNIQIRCSSQNLKLRTHYMIEFYYYGTLSNYYVPLGLDFFEFDIMKEGAPVGAEHFNELQIGGKTYNDVLRVEIDTISNIKTKIYCIYLAAGTGLVQYDYKTGETFGLR